NDKAYDGTTPATVTTAGAALSGVWSGDQVVLDASAVVGTFASKAVGKNIQVVVSGLALKGTDGSNYVLAPLAKKANITPNLRVVGPLSVNSGGTGVITASMLFADSTSAPSSVIYTLSTVPASGTLKKGPAVLMAGDTFTQADIDNGLVTFTGAANGE